MSKEPFYLSKRAYYRGKNRHRKKAYNYLARNAQVSKEAYFRGKRDLQEERGQVCTSVKKVLLKQKRPTKCQKGPTIAAKETYRSRRGLL